VDQDPAGRQGDLVRAERSMEVWARDLSDGSKAAVLFNRSKRPEDVAVRWSDLGWEARQRVRMRDLWERRDLGTATEGHAVSVPSHGAAFLKLTRQD
jgi:alpha-galactosidase